MANFRILALFAVIAALFVLFYQQQLNLAGYHGIGLFTAQVGARTSLFRDFLANSNSSFTSLLGSDWNLTEKLVYGPAYAANYTFLQGSGGPLGPNVSSEASAATLSQIGGGVPLQTAAYLSNSSAPSILVYSMLYPLYLLSLLDIVNPLGTAMPGLGIQAASPQLSSRQLGHEDPLGRYQALAALYSLGFPVVPGGYGAFPPGAVTGKGSLMPFDVTDVYSVYGLEMAKLDILQQAQILGTIFSCGAFGSGNSSAVPQAGLYGIAISSSPGTFSNITGGYTITGTTGSSGGLSLFTTDWLALISYESPGRLNLMENGGTVCTGRNASSASLSALQLLYLMAYSQYQNGMLQQILYNKSIRPNIAFMGYSSNALVVDVDSVNLSSFAGGSLVVDNSPLLYRRYYNFLAANDSLSPGYHSVSLTMGNTTLTSSLYVEPHILVNLLRTPGNISITIFNSPYGALNITDFSVTDGSGLVSTYPNFSTHGTAVLSIAAPSGCTIGERMRYTIDFGTQYGAEHLISAVQCV